jgi:predicted AAA+ superfamily ATPase
VGKSTLLRNCFPDAEMVIFDPVQDVENARHDPDLFLSSHRTPLILDEIQYAPEVAAAVKRAIDRDRRPGMFLMSGSQQWQVMARLADSLAGRVAILTLEGFTLGERSGAPEAWLGGWIRNSGEPPRRRLPSTCGCAESIWRGSLPEAAVLPESRVGGFHEDYFRTYIERDARQAGNVSDWQEFAKFARLVFALSGQEINRNQLGRELGIHMQTAKSWLALLTATLQWHEVPPLLGSAVKRLSKKPKGYGGDTGLMCAALAIGSPSAVLSHPSWGALFETAAMGELRRQLAVAAPSARLYHWRSHGGAEVDAVIESDGRYYPIEIKGASRPGPRDMSGLKAFRATYPDRTAPGLVLAPAETAYPLAPDIWVVPWDAAP